MATLHNESEFHAILAKYKEGGSYNIQHGTDGIVEVFSQDGTCLMRATQSSDGQWVVVEYGPRAKTAWEKE